VSGGRRVREVYRVSRVAGGGFVDQVLNSSNSAWRGGAGGASDYLWNSEDLPVLRRVGIGQSRAMIPESEIGMTQLVSELGSRARSSDKIRVNVPS
jgi:hypothetical protein